ncbi:MAG: DUF4097 domain-containing protein [Oscillospiraceae bacterium]|nr:DUF4097 domain-containing protein [Oscillospiraceae bacterium]
MSKTRVVTIICWIVSALALTGLLVWLVAGTVFSGWFGNWNNIPFGINFGTSTERLSGPFELDRTYNVSVGGVDSIRIDWVSGDVVVRPHSGNDIVINEYAQRELRDNERLRYSISGDTLEINFLERGFSVRRMPAKRVEVLVPYSLSDSLNRLSVSSVSADIRITDMTATTLRGNTTSGAFDAVGTFNIANIDTVSGRIEIAGEIYDADLDSVSGRITMTSTAQGARVESNSVSGRMDIAGDFDRVVIGTTSGSMDVESTTAPSSFRASSVSGSITITLPADATISVRHSAVSGSFSSDIPVTLEGRGADFDISSVSGSTRIRALGDTDH